jgi:hypothetical protein
MDYHNLYLTADVLLLSDIWANFRDVCYKIYNLDASYYYTAPSLSWDAWLYHSTLENKKVGKSFEIELITDIDYIAKSVGLYTILYKKDSKFLLHICGNKLCYMQSFLLKPDILPNPVCDYKIAPILFDTKCIKLNISGENITLADFTMI